MVLDFTKVDWPSDLWAEDEPDDAGYRAYLEAEYAEHIGAATQLAHCYLCEPDFQKRHLPAAGPLRGVVRMFVGGGSDPTEVLVLTCGHEII
jgi:hypothetical protein